VTAKGLRLSGDKNFTAVILLIRSSTSQGVYPQVLLKDIAPTQAKIKAL